jgi:hypothetical protein
LLQPFGDLKDMLANGARGERVIDRQHILQKLSGDAIRHERRPLRFQKQQLRREMLREQGGQGTERLGGVRLTGTLVQAGALDRDRAEDGPDLHRVIPLTALVDATVCTGTLRLQVCRHLLLHHHRLQRLEDGFPFGEGQAQRGGGQVLPLQAGNLPRFGLTILGRDHHLDGAFHGGSPVPRSGHVTGH